MQYRAQPEDILSCIDLSKRMVEKDEAGAISHLQAAGFAPADPYPNPAKLKAFVTNNVLDGNEDKSDAEILATVEDFITGEGLLRPSESNIWSNGSGLKLTWKYFDQKYQSEPDVVALVQCSFSWDGGCDLDAIESACNAAGYAAKTRKVNDGHVLDIVRNTPNRFHAYIQLIHLKERAQRLTEWTSPHASLFVITRRYTAFQPPR